MVVVLQINKQSLDIKYPRWSKREINHSWSIVTIVTWRRYAFWIYRYSGTSGYYEPLTIFLVLQTIFFTPVVVKYRGKNLDITKPRYSGHILLACEPPGRSCALSPAPPQERPGELGSQANILPVPWPFHCNFFVNVPRGTPGKFWWGVCLPVLQILALFQTKKTTLHIRFRPCL